MVQIGGVRLDHGQAWNLGRPAGEPPGDPGEGVDREATEEELETSRSAPARAGPNGV